MVASLVLTGADDGLASALASEVAPSEISCTLRVGSMVVGLGLMRGSLKAWERSLSSVRWEKETSRIRVRMWENVGESIRSEVSLRRRRRAVWEEEGDGGRDCVNAGS